MPTLEAIRPYVEQLFDDDNVQRQLSRAAAQVRAANPKRGSQKRVLKEPQRRRRLVASPQAAYAAAQTIQEAPQKQNRRRRRGRVLALLVLGAGVAVAV